MMSSTPPPICMPTPNTWLKYTYTKSTKTSLLGSDNNDYHFYVSVPYFFSCAKQLCLCQNRISSCPCCHTNPFHYKISPELYELLKTKALHYRSTAPSYRVGPEECVYVLMKRKIEDCFLMETNLKLRNEMKTLMPFEFKEEY